MRRLAVVVAVVVAAVSLGAGCGPTFLPASVVVNERVIAVTASPPEAVPGQEVTLSPVVVSPGGDLCAVGAPECDPGTYRATWWRCPDSDSDALGDFAQCTIPGERRDVGEG